MRNIRPTWRRDYFNAASALCVKGYRLSGTFRPRSRDAASRSFSPIREERSSFTVVHATTAVTVLNGAAGLLEATPNSGGSDCYFWGTERGRGKKWEERSNETDLFAI